MAPAHWLASPLHVTMPDIMFSATPAPALPLTMTRRLLVHAGAVVADVPVDLDGDRRVEAARRWRAGPSRVEDAPERLVGVRVQGVWSVCVAVRASERGGEVDGPVGLRRHVARSQK